MAIYGFARLVDQLGDEVEGDRLALLDLLEADLDRVYDGEPRASDPAHARRPTVRELRPAARAVRAADRGEPARPGAGAPTRPSTTSSTTATLSANPVGELVLHVFGVATPERIALSDRVCTALQLVEHWQDVAEDFARGRVYLPAEDLARFGVADADLGARETGAALRQLLAFEVARARELLDEGAPLVGTLARPRAHRGRGLRRRRARRTLEAIAARGYDVLAGPPKAGKAARVRATLVPGGTAGDGRPSRLRTSTAAASRASRARASTPACGCCRPTSATRCSPSTRSRGGSTTSPTATCRPTRSSPRSAQTREQLGAIDESDDPVLVAVADAARRFPIPLGAFGELVDGAELDVRGTEYATFADLERYCRCVAGSIGRLALGVFDCSDRERRRAARRRPRRRAPDREHPARPRRGRSRTGASTCRARTSSASAATSSTGASTGRSSS